MTAQLIAVGDDHLRQGRFADAIDAYRSVVEARPDLADVWFNLAWAQRAERHFAASLQSYEQAIAHGIVRPEEARLNRATILYDHLGATDLAIGELNAALRLNPDFLQAWLNLGNIAEERGDADGAKAAYRRAVAIAPRAGRGHARLAVIETAAGRAEEVVSHLKQLLDQAPTAEDRAEILFALGGALDATAQFDDAFQAYEAANWFAASFAQHRYDPEAQERLVDRLIAAYPHPVAAVAQDAGGIASPVFICGMFRSGSTLAEQILGRHSAVHAAGEREDIPAIVRSLDPYPEAAAAMSADQAAALRARYLAEGAAGGVTTDKRCDNFLHIGLIKSLFPGAKIVHTVRQPLDNLLSIYFLHFGDAVSYGDDLRNAAHYFRQYRRLMAHWTNLYPDDIAALDYDRLVADPRSEMARIMRFLDLRWEDQCLAAGATDGAVRTASAWQVRAPLHTRSSGRWRHYARHMATIREMRDSD
ncbi:sulfotransferase [Sphingomonas sp. RT2P30]|uniref:tetratricopeptide repeat-containing sulfotransferase family protein n=1 Tax=Parasphingomonas halimpatiens TaxID=3096162 RepID=UPI002FC8B462